MGSIGASSCSTYEPCGQPPCYSHRANHIAEVHPCISHAQHTSLCQGCSLLHPTPHIRVDEAQADLHVPYAVYSSL